VKGNEFIDTENAVSSSIGHYELNSEEIPYADLFLRALTGKRATALNRVRPEHVYLGMRKVEAMGAGKVVCEGREMLMLASNNYLGLAADPRLIEAGITAIKSWGSSTSGSRLLNGTNDLHIRLETRLAEYKKVESVVVYQSGYMANLGVLSALLSKDDVVIIDKLAHASIIDGCTLAGASLRSFKHQDMKALEAVLQSIAPDVGKLIVVDGIYSMDGDFAKFPALMQLARRYGARVMVDDAHATGVAGPTGRGTAEHFGLDEPDIITGTLSKAFGCVGGFVGAKKEITEFIKYNSRAFIYSTSLCPSLTASLLKAVDIVAQEPERRENLWRCTHYLLSALKGLGYNTGVSETPIIPIILDDESTMFELVQRLHDEDIFASPVIYPACPRKEPRVRISLCSDHTIQDMDRVLVSLRRHGRAMGIIS
jgi:8-amino-7-oxononanoate synthase